MKEKEQEIIAKLRQDARASLNLISQKIGMPISTVYDKINRLSAEGLIKRYTVLVDFAKMGYSYWGKIAVKINKAQRNDFLVFLQSHRNINSIYEIDTGFDFLIETVHQDVKEYIAFVEGLQEAFDVLEFHEYQIVKEVEREKFS